MAHPEAFSQHPNGHEVADQGPVEFDINAVEFDRAPLYQKQADPTRAVAARRVEQAEPVQTRVATADGEHYAETSNLARPGDYIVTGVQGEEYVVTAENFARLYQPAHDQSGAAIAGRYQPRNIVRALPNPTGVEIVIMAPWGQPMRGDADCVLVESQVTGERYLIARGAFEDTYRPIEADSDGV